MFTRIYERNEWGGRHGEYCSGSGSSEYHASRYADVIRAFVKDKSVATIVDLGCGDFVVGSRLLFAGVRYVGVDIVAALVRRNQEMFGCDQVSFECLDILSDALPDGELCLIRQVLQHLSNAQIAVVLKKIHKYRYVVVTEHYPAPSVHPVPNKDKPHGADIRVYDNSGVYLDLPPFNVRLAGVLLEMNAGVNLVSEGEVLRSFLIENLEVPGAAATI